jgi:hypothetical protein
MQMKCMDLGSELAASRLAKDRRNSRSSLFVFWLSKRKQKYVDSFVPAYGYISLIPKNNSLF